MTRSDTAAAVADLLNRSADGPGPAGGPPSRWHAFVAAGLPWAAVPSTRGGGGGDVADAADILREVGRAAAAVPTGDTDLLGDWLLQEGELPQAPELLVVAPGTRGDDLQLHRHGDAVVLDGTAHRVPWASRSGRLVAVVSGGDGSHVVSVPMDRLTVAGGRSLAGEDRDSVRADGVALTADEWGRCPDTLARQLRARGAATRVLLVHGAVDAVVALADVYCAARTQFGRSLHDFQVVAHQLAVLHERVTLVAAAAELAVATLDGSASWEEAAAAKIVAGEVATLVARTAHQLHGAIGVSEEYALHELTRRLWAWRDEYGGEHEWAGRLGRRLLTGGADALWPWLTHSTKSST